MTFPSCVGHYLELRSTFVGNLDVLFDFWGVPVSIEKSKITGMEHRDVTFHSTMWMPLPEVVEMHKETEKAP